MNCEKTQFFLNTLYLCEESVPERALVEDRGCPQLDPLQPVENLLPGQHEPRSGQIS